MSLNFQQTYTLELLQNRLSKLDEEDDNLDKKAQENIPSITIIFAFASAFKIFEDARDAMDNVLLVLIFVIYILVILVSLYIQLPKPWIEIIDPNPDSIRSFVAETSEGHFYWKLVGAYSEAIKTNTQTVSVKIGLQRLANALTVANIVVIIFMAAR